MGIYAYSSLDDIKEKAWETTKNTLAGTTNLVEWRECYVSNVLEEMNGANSILPKGLKFSAAQLKDRSLSQRMCAQVLMETHHCVSINMGSDKDSDDSAYMPAIYSSKDGIYHMNHDYFAKYVGILHPEADEGFTEKVMYHIKTNSQRVNRTGFKDGERDLIPFQNGILDYTTKELIVDYENDVAYHDDPQYVFTWYVHCNWNPDAQSPQIKMPNGKIWEFEEWLLDIMDGSKEDAHLLKQVIGSVFRPFVDFQQSTWFYSTSGSSGKTTILDMIFDILGNSAVALNLKEIEGEDSAFNLQQVLESGAVFIGADENPVKMYLDKSDKYKSIVTHGWVHLNRKFKKNVSAKFFCSMIQCGNDTPRLQDNSPSNLRRWNAIRFPKTFGKNEKIKEIKDVYLKRKDVQEYICKACLKDIPDYYEFMNTDNTEETLRMIQTDNSPVLQFVYSVLHEGGYMATDDDGDANDGGMSICPTWSKIPLPILYQVFVAWYKLTHDGQKPMSDKSFYKDLEIALQNDDTWEIDKRKTLNVSKKYENEVLNNPWLAIKMFGVNELIDQRYTDSNDYGKALMPRFEKQYTGGLFRR